MQRVSRASVSVEGKVDGAIGPGLCILLGIAHADSAETAADTARKVARLRVFPNDKGRFDFSLLDTGGSALVVSQFTLLADTSKGNRPSFAGAAEPEQARELYEGFVRELEALGVAVETGVFGAAMRVDIANDGPVTVVIDR